jgi:DMSO/TMAO reductase YedYZ molybdopterin-dependent catalytic subunit
MTLRIEGEVATPLSLSFEALNALPRVEVSSVLPGKPGTAVRLSALLEKAGPTSGARWLTVQSADGSFAVSVPLDDVRPTALVAYALDGAPLPEAKGGPLRFYVDAASCGSGQVDACANVKGLGVLRLTVAREPDVGHAHAR